MILFLLLTNGSILSILSIFREIILHSTFTSVCDGLRERRKRLAPRGSRETAKRDNRQRRRVSTIQQLGRGPIRCKDARWVRCNITDAQIVALWLVFFFFFFFFFFFCQS
jgi:hypothetical protein